MRGRHDPQVTMLALVGGGGLELPASARSTLFSTSPRALRFFLCPTGFRGWARARAVWMAIVRSRYLGGSGRVGAAGKGRRRLAGYGAKYFGLYAAWGYSVGTDANVSQFGTGSGRPRGRTAWASCCRRRSGQRSAVRKESCRPPVRFRLRSPVPGDRGLHVCRGPVLGWP